MATNGSLGVKLEEGVRGEWRLMKRIESGRGFVAG